MSTKSLSHKGLQFEEPLLFDLPEESSGIDLPKPPDVAPRLGGMERKAPLNLPNLSEPRVVRHFTRLSQKNFAIDTGFYPLGSCTMKHNPRLNEQTARFPGFADLHPWQDRGITGALEVMAQLVDWLKLLTGLSHVALSPAAGAHGELCGMMSIKAALAHHGRAHKTTVLVPESAHGTNPATAVACGFTVRALPADASGKLELATFEAAMDDTVGAAMITNPNTCGIFEEDMPKIAEILHANGAYLYCDGANFNAIAGLIRPADLGVDAMHINLHKTFSTPHGGGGPGSGPVAFSSALAPFAPLPWIMRGEDGTPQLFTEAAGPAQYAAGPIKAFWGQFGTFVRALSYMESFGTEGIAQASTDAVLNANYLRVKLQDVLNLPFPGPCMHEVLFDDTTLKQRGLTTLDLAKALIDRGFHPMTMYFPLVVSGAMLIEPTESESLETLDQFVTAVREILNSPAKTAEAAPIHTPRSRVDEVAAARKPVLRWKSVD